MSAADRDLILRHLQDIPDGLGSRENIADALAERLVVIDRDDLPKVTPDPIRGREADLWAEHDDANGTWWDLRATSPEFMRGRALEMIALLEHQAKLASAYENAVAELTCSIDLGTGTCDWSPETLARDLIAGGWAKTEVAR